MFSTLIVVMISQNVCLCPNSSGYLYIYFKCVHFFNIPFTSKKQKKIFFEASGNGTKGLQKMYQHIFKRTYENTVITVRIYSI